MSRILEISEVDIPITVTYVAGQPLPAHELEQLPEVDQPVRSPVNGKFIPDPANEKHWAKRADVETGRQLAVVPGATLTEPARRYRATVYHPRTGAKFLELDDAMVEQCTSAGQAEKLAMQGIGKILGLQTRHAQDFAMAWAQYQMEQEHLNRLSELQRRQQKLSELSEDASPDEVQKVIRGE